MARDIEREITNTVETLDRGFLGDVGRSIDTNLENLGEGLSHLESEGRKFIKDPMGIKALQKSQEEALEEERELREQARLDAIAQRQIRSTQASRAAEGVRQRTVQTTRATGAQARGQSLGVDEDILGL